jgi:hypothetical protein
MKILFTENLGYVNIQKKSSKLKLCKHSEKELDNKSTNLLANSIFDKSN